MVLGMDRIRSKMVLKTEFTFCSRVAISLSESVGSAPTPPRPTGTFAGGLFWTTIGEIAVKSWSKAICISSPYFSRRAIRSRIEARPSSGVESPALLNRAGPAPASWLCAGTVGRYSRYCFMSSPSPCISTSLSPITFITSAPSPSFSRAHGSEDSTGRASLPRASDYTAGSVQRGHAANLVLTALPTVKGRSRQEEPRHSCPSTEPVKRRAGRPGELPLDLGCPASIRYRRGVFNLQPITNLDYPSPSHGSSPPSYRSEEKERVAPTGSRPASPAQVITEFQVETIGVCCEPLSVPRFSALSPRTSKEAPAGLDGWKSVPMGLSAQRLARCPSSQGRRRYRLPTPRRGSLIVPRSVKGFQAVRGRSQGGPGWVGDRIEG